MPKFILHRITRLTQNPGAEKITPGLEAAASLHRLTCYEHAPERFESEKEALPELRKTVTEYLARTEREMTAHLERMAATHDGEASGRGNGKAVKVEPPPAQVPMVNVQYGYNWVLLYWNAAEHAGKPWGYRVYRTDKTSAPALVATVCEAEALLPDQPEKVKLYYCVTAFNGSGESAPSGEVGLMLNGPDEDEAAAMPAVKIPKHEMTIRRELGLAMLTFVQKLGATTFGEDEDSVMRQVATEEYRQAVEKAARQGVEVSLCWHTLATWKEEGKERIGYFSRALECVKAETEATPPVEPRAEWSSVHLEADCLFEIGRVHFYEDAPAAARDFLSQALLLAQRADALRVAAKVEDDDRLEGRIAELLLQLPDE